MNVSPFSQPESTTREKVISTAAAFASNVRSIASEALEQASAAASDAISKRLAVPFDRRATRKTKRQRFQAKVKEQVASLAATDGVPASLKRTGALAGFLALGYAGAPLWAWTAAGATALYGARASKWTWAGYGALAAVFNLPPLRRKISGGVMQAMEELQFLPTISETEQTAIEAGNVWMDAELFSGKPDLRKLNRQPFPKLTEEEQAFLDGPVEELCRMTDDWEVWQRGDLSEEVWNYLKEEGFFGLIIPKEYGGKGFSATANSAVVQKLVACSLPLSITVMVPNSLGPAELLLHYGTEEQKERHLPRLARGEEIPAFALTESEAGSDAGAMESRGEVFKGEDGELYLRLNWKKRYISLAAVADLLGLAFKLYDPENHLGKGEELGITCALVPTDAEGVVIEERHDPLGVPFYNSPTEGHDVVVPIDAIIGGEAGAGKGWQMLMESLSAGRGISVPAQTAGSGKYVTRVAGAHAAVREQFGLPIGKFEGVEEPLARIAGFAYLLEAARRYTTGAVDQGEKPAVISAIMKYHTTELQRQIINDGMDILGGNAISLGPRNLLGHGYIGLPISITVEGANILTRTLMIFGQGAIRCHPYIYDEVQALTSGDVKAFDRALWKHVGHIVQNGSRAFLLGLTRGQIARSPVSGPAAPYWKRLAWASASFAFMADLALVTLGGRLKRKEKLSGRFADILSWMYLGAATLRRFEVEGRRKEHEPYLHWAMQYAFAQIQEAFDGLYENMEIPGLTWFFRGVLAPWSRLNTIGAPPSDALGHKVASGIQELGGDRQWLTEGIFVPEDEETALGRLEKAFRLSWKAYHVGQKIKDAVRAGDLPKKRPRHLLDEALEKGIITEEERSVVERAEEARADYIKVDAFDLETYRRQAGLPGEQAVEGGAPMVDTGGDGAPDESEKPDPETV